MEIGLDAILGVIWEQFYVVTIRHFHIGTDAIGGHLATLKGNIELKVTKLHLKLILNQFIDEGN
jgi:hypothetical protein